MTEKLSPLYLGLSGESWDRALIYSLVAAFLAAGLVAVATVGSIRAHKREAEVAKADLDQFRIKTGGEIVRAQAGASAANASAAEAQGIAARAHQRAGEAAERAALLEREAAVARLEAQRLKAEVSWREIGPAQAEAMRLEAQHAPGSVNIRYVSGDPEVLAYAEQFLSIFRNAGWRVGVGATVLNRPVYGLSTNAMLLIPAARLVQVLDAGQVEYRRDLPIPVGIGMNVTEVPGADVLFIGSKPRA